MRSIELRALLCAGCVCALGRHAAGQTAPDERSQNAQQTASTSDPRAIAARRALIEDAMRARVAGDHVRALDLGRRAVELQSSPTLRRFVAEELLVNRRWSEAAGMAELCENDFRSAPASRPRDEHIESCRQVRSEALSHTGRITIHWVAAAPADSRVTINGSLVPPALIGVPMVVDEGRSRVEVTHAAFRPISRDITVLAGATVDVPLELTPRDAPRPLPDPSGPSRARPNAGIVAPPGPPAIGGRALVTRAPSPLLWVGSAVGAIGAAAAVGLEVGAVVVAGAFDRQCFPNDIAQPGALCAERYVNDQRSIDALQIGAVSGLVAAGVGATIAVIGALNPARRTVTALVTPAGLQLGGIF